MKQRVFALGFFDGVHLGHGALLRAARKRAQEIGGVSCALLFDRHPSHVLGSNPVCLLNTAEERTLLMKHLYQIDEVITFPFDKTTASMPWDSFVQSVLIEKLNARHVVAGFDFRFGHNGEGTTDKLRRFCMAAGIGCDIVDRVTLDGVTVSSSLIRELVSKGDVRRAAHFLGHFHFFYATVEHGAALGRRIGIPTINQHFSSDACLPLFGVYVTRVHIDGKTYRGVTNIGTRPTVTDAQIVKAETYILDFDGNLYNQHVGLELIALIRPEKRFSDLTALKAAISKDIDFSAHFPM